MQITTVGKDEVTPGLPSPTCSATGSPPPFCEDDCVSEKFNESEIEVSQVCIDDQGQYEGDIDRRDDYSVVRRSDLWILDDITFGVVSPLSFKSPGESIAFVYWFKHLCGFIQAHDGAQNPYRKFSMVALSSPLVLDTIISLATEFMYYLGHMSTELAVKRNALALRSLRKALTTSDPSGGSHESHESRCLSGDELSLKQATLAAVLLQIANSCFVGWIGVHPHLACAIYLLRDLGYIRSPVTDFIPRLLIQRFAMLDINASLIHHRRPHLPLSCWLYMPNDNLDESEPSFREMTGCPQPILGFLARICNLAADLSENHRDESEILDEAFVLETELRLYELSHIKTTRNNDSIDTRHLDTLNQCFYWCTHLVLQRRIYRDSVHSARVQKTVSTLIGLMKSMPIGCGPDSSLSLPFHLTTREAIREEDRAWARETNQKMKPIYPNRTRDELMANTEAAWQQADACFKLR